MVLACSGIEIDNCNSNPLYPNDYSRRSVEMLIIFLRYTLPNTGILFQTYEFILKQFFTESSKAVYSLVFVFLSHTHIFMHTI